MIEILQISLIAFMLIALGKEGMIFNFYQRMICQLPDWLCKPLGGCYLCFTGQVMFWFYLFKYFEDYNLIDHLFFVSAGIFASAIYNKIFNWLCE
jgi:hypothetical protein